MRAPAERVLILGLGALYQDLSNFIAKLTDADLTGAEWPHSAETEAVLGLTMAELAGQLEIHARQQSKAAALASGVPVIRVACDKPDVPAAIE